MVHRQELLLLVIKPTHLVHGQAHLPEVKAVNRAQQTVRQPIVDHNREAHRPEVQLLPEVLRQAATVAPILHPEAVVRALAAPQVDLLRDLALVLALALALAVQDLEIRDVKISQIEASQVLYCQIAC